MASQMPVYFSLDPGDEDMIPSIVEKRVKDQSNIKFIVNNGLGSPFKLGRSLIQVGELIGPCLTLFSIGDSLEYYPGTFLKSEDLCEFLRMTPKLRTIRLESCPLVDGNVLDVMAEVCGGTVEDIRITGVPMELGQISESAVRKHLLQTGPEVSNHFPKLQTLKLVDQEHLMPDSKVAQELNERLSALGVDVYVGTSAAEAEYDDTED
eukprot:gnl/TRDRNA2_/TRDRNA2_145969_c0_seq2.p1 gnl/TRDRNA2_/TRDRNA2_145969_c0~~gnl/TRDRNA2_/TRDRNA2_145969_c0_seq2.p1  ORF type:complete len:208 (+),score=21.64 gnl/TRDRNA2_/TRDRNA2_145969_c0_seq2:106-729(+)